MTPFFSASVKGEPDAGWEKGRVVGLTGAGLVCAPRSGCERAVRAQTKRAQTNFGKISLRIKLSTYFAVSGFFGGLASETLRRYPGTSSSDFLMQEKNVSGSNQSNIE